jgi:uncharacterized protein
MPLPVYVDFDDVLCESARTLARISGERYGKTVAFEDIYTFDLHASFGLDTLEQQDLFTLFHDADMLAGIPPVPGAIEGMRAWAEAGCQIEIVTGRPPVTAPVSQAWLRDYQVPYHGILFVDKYQRGHGPVSGVRQLNREALSSCQYALIVDDSPDIIRFLEAETDMQLVLFDRPWNRALDVEKMRRGIRRCHDWSALVDAFPAPGVSA